MSKLKGKKLTAQQLKSEIVKLFQRHSRKRLNAKQILKKLRIVNSKDAAQDALEKLSKNGMLVHISDNKFKLNKSEDGKATSPTSSSTSGKSRTRYIGRVDMTRRGSAYIICDDLENDVHVSARRTNGALNGDTVRVAAWKPRGRDKMEGEIVEVVERAREHFLGTLRLTRKYGVLMSDDPNMPMDIMVQHPDTIDAKDGDLVVVKVTDWPTRHNHSPVGKVTSVLGKLGDSDAVMKSILISNGFELEFPEAVLAEAATLNDNITAADLEVRRDMRKVTTFTIDPNDAKDFDDALSLEYLDNGQYEIGVHIADVTHYVKPGTALDQEAFERSTSVYLVDRVLPMLPEKLSNGLCSLRPNEDKFTFSAVFTFDKNDKIINRWFGKTLTHSNRRFTYNQAQEVIDNGEGDCAKEIQKINTLAKQMRKERFKNGSVDFNADEVRFKLAEDGTPLEVYVKERKAAHMLIEEFMLLANKEVAAYVSKKGQDKEIPFVYRVHDEPDPDRVSDLVSFAKEMGVQIHASSPDQIAKSYNRLAKQALNDPTLKILEPLAIRTMAKAEYSSDNIGHYGLGFDFYSHFTSPIRRYSDVLAHRILNENLQGRTKRVNKEKLELKCKHISRQERKATDAERESTKYKQVEFMKKHIGDTFDGVISGIIDRGIFVETVGSKCEGMIPFETMSEPFEVGAGRLKVTGRRSNKVMKMGDSIKVCIVGANLEKRRIEMELVEE
ncbi:MAG: ribonuclease R [Bacteroidota bacterium]